MSSLKNLFAGLLLLGTVLLIMQHALHRPVAAAPELHISSQVEGGIAKLISQTELLGYGLMDFGVLPLPPMFVLVHALGLPETRRLAEENASAVSEGDGRGASNPPPADGAHPRLTRVSPRCGQR